MQQIWKRGDILMHSTTEYNAMTPIQAQVKPGINQCLDGCKLLNYQSFRHSDSAYWNSRIPADVSLIPGIYCEGSGFVTN